MTGKEKNVKTLFRKIERRERQAEEYKNRLWKVSRARRIKQRLRRLIRALRRQTDPILLTEQNLALDWQQAGDRKELYIREEKIVVYTALYGAYDIIREPLTRPDNIDYVLLTDQEFPPKTVWKRCGREELLPQELRKDSVLCNRWCKMHPHLLFPEYEYSVYVDANIWIISDMTPVAAGLDRYPIAMFRHKKRDCAYDEVQACIDQKKADPASLRLHEKLLYAHGVPPKWGLLEASVIARKHGDPRCVALMEDWWNAFRENSRRDQISLIDALWQSRIPPEQIGVLGSNLTRCNLFVQTGHAGK